MLFRSISIARQYCREIDILVFNPDFLCYQPPQICVKIYRDLIANRHAAAVERENRRVCPAVFFNQLAGEQRARHRAIREIRVPHALCSRLVFGDFWFIHKRYYTSFRESFSPRFPVIFRENRAIMDGMNEGFFYEIWPVRNVGELEVLTYSSSVKLIRGDVVEVPFGRGKIAGVVRAEVSQPDFATKSVSRKVFAKSLPRETVDLAIWISRFYSTKIGVVWQNFLPSGILKNRRIISDKDKQKSYSFSRKTDDSHKLTEQQEAALSELREISDGTAILRGITGSGKTEIYKNLAMDAVRAGKSVIILVPEISLTTQLVDDFREFFVEPILRKNDVENEQIFAKVLSTNSAQKETERAKIWSDALTANQPVVAIGPRSALFLPLKNVGLIMIDEEHEPTYVQDKAPRYNAKTVAAKLAELHTKTAEDFAKNDADFREKSSQKTSGCKLILGSATPLVADVYGAIRRNRPIVEMTELAKSGAKPAEITVVDMRNRENFTSESKIFSRKLLDEMKRALYGGKQVLLFHNRRGSASTTMCEVCGWVATCPVCFLPLTLHADEFELRCHLDGTREKVPTSCPVCGSTEILHKGIGTKRIEEECRRIFREILAKDEKAIRRFDGDTAAVDSVAKVYDELKSGRTRIIIGTQQIAKGLDLPLLETVGVVQADAGLNLPDFGARERTFELIAQAVGRVGRHSAETAAVIQTYQPDAPAVNFAKTQDFWGFYAAEIRERERAHFPPFAHLLKITASYKTEMAAVKNSRNIAQNISRKYPQGVSLLGPAPSFYERLRENYRWQIVVRASSRKILNDVADEISHAKNSSGRQKFPAKNITIEPDANSLI